MRRAYTVLFLLLTPLVALRAQEATTLTEEDVLS